MEIYNYGVAYEKLLNEDIRQVLDEMARLGHIGKYEIYIRTNDAGSIPHMHIWDKDTQGQKFHTCVRLDKAEYFHHTGKEDVLSSRDKKELVLFLMEQHKKLPITNWNYAKILWNENNSNVLINDDQSMPDYTQL